MNDTVRRLRTRQLEVGGAVLALHKRGYRLADIADALGLADERDAQRAAAAYLLATTERRDDGKKETR